MKRLYFVLTLLCLHSYLFSQSLSQQIKRVNERDDLFSNSQHENFLLANESFNSFQLTFASATQPEFLLGDSIPLPRRNFLHHDDPAYNKKTSIIIPIVEVPLINTGSWALDRYVMNASYSHISAQTWKYNIENGWVWDQDDFPTNFSVHPYGGSYYFNAARANGYTFCQSFPFIAYGSVMWEYFGEKDR